MRSNPPVRPHDVEIDLITSADHTTITSWTTRSLSNMAPARGKHIAEATPPTNVAQLGMGWDLVTGTIDLGLGVFDAIIMVGEWIREYAKRKAVKTKAEIMLKRGKKQGNSKRTRSLKFFDDSTEVKWT